MNEMIQLCVVDILSDKSGKIACLKGVSTALKIPLNVAYIIMTLIGIAVETIREHT